MALADEKIPGFPGASIVLPSLDEAAMRQYLQTVTNTVNRINSGKMNVVINVILTASAASTTITDARLSPFSGVLFDPMTANAAAELAAGTMFVATADRRMGEWTITHANNAQTDRQFRMVALG